MPNYHKITFDLQPSIRTQQLFDVTIHFASYQANKFTKTPFLYFLQIHAPWEMNYMLRHVPLLFLRQRIISIKPIIFDVGSGQLSNDQRRPMCWMHRNITDIQHFYFDKSTIIIINTLQKQRSRWRLFVCT